MSDRSILSVDLPNDLKAKWQERCRADGKSVSEMTRLVITHLVNKPSAKLQVSEISEPDDKRARLEIRLTHSELAAIEEIAKRSGASRNHWVANLIRAYLTHKPQLGMEEMAAIGTSNKELAAIGRNLNQIARALNAGDCKSTTGLDLNGLSERIATHIASVSAAIRANVDRWRITWQ